MNVLSLFAGIGGLDLGLERAGMTVVGQVELDPFRRSILARHWPQVPRHDDVRTAGGWWVAQPRPAVHVVAGGFPCQPFSTAGRQRGTADERWGWPWMVDVVRRVRPWFVIVENVAALITDRVAFGWILGDLAELGFDAEWSMLSACAMGAPHLRERLFVVAYAHGIDGPKGLGARARIAPLPGPDGGPRAWRDRVDRSVPAARADGRETHGSAGRMVAAGGNAVVVPVAEYIGRMVMACM